MYYAKVIQQPVTFFCMSLETAPNFDWISSDSFYLLNFCFGFFFFLVITSSIAVSISQFFQNCQRRQILLSFASCVGKVLIYSHYLEQTELFVIFFKFLIVSLFRFFSTFFQLMSLPCPCTSSATFSAEEHLLKCFGFCLGYF